MSLTKTELRIETTLEPEPPGDGRVISPLFIINARGEVLARIPNPDSMMDDEHVLGESSDLETARNIRIVARQAFLLGERFALNASIRDMQDHLMATDGELRRS